MHIWFHFKCHSFFYLYFISLFKECVFFPRGKLLYCFRNETLNRPLILLSMESIFKGE